MTDRGEPHDSEAGVYTKSELQEKFKSILNLTSIWTVVIMLSVNRQTVLNCHFCLDPDHCHLRQYIVLLSFEVIT